MKPQQQQQTLLILLLVGAASLVPSCIIVQGFAIRQPIIPHKRSTPSLPAVRSKTLTFLGSSSSSDSTTVLERPVVEERAISNSTDFDSSMTNLQTRSLALPSDPTTSVIPKQQQDKSKGKVLELAGLGTWIASLSGFLLYNNYVAPFPSMIQNVPVEYFGLAHALSAMLFGGGIILTTLLEWLAVSSKNASVLDFYFGKVPILDKMVVLPALTLSIVSGVGLAVDHYDMLGQAPFHIVAAISTLLAFAGWWAATDLTTQGAAKAAIDEWKLQSAEVETDIPKIVQLRKISNVVSCIFVMAIYSIMVLKPGFSAA